MPGEQLVYICGSGHSGSTLLDMLLSGHDEISGLGEIHRLYLGLNKSIKPYFCTCGDEIKKCYFWIKVLKELQILAGMSNSDIEKKFITTDPSFLKMESNGLFMPYPKDYKLYSFGVNRVSMVIGSKRIWSLLSFVSHDVKIHQRIINNSLILYEAVRRAWGTPIIVDSTKNPARLKGLYLQSSKTFRVLHLIRDGRAVCYSRMRRDKLPMEECARIWQAEWKKLWLTLLTIPKSLITHVRYEALCRDPRNELTRICQVLGIEYQPSMSEFRSNNRHNIGGNSMRFRYGEGEIHLDEKWRKELQLKDLQTFEKIAGKMNRKLGYES